MRKFKVGEQVEARVESIQIGTVKAGKFVRGMIIALSPDRKFVKRLLEDNTELLIETQFLR